jgi:hypothetical protein
MREVLDISGKVGRSLGLGREVCCYLDIPAVPAFVTVFPDILATSVHDPLLVT